MLVLLLEGTMESCYWDGFPKFLSNRRSRLFVCVCVDDDHSLTRVYEKACLNSFCTEDSMIVDIQPTGIRLHAGDRFTAFEPFSTV